VLAGGSLLALAGRQRWLALWWEPEEVTDHIIFNRSSSLNLRRAQRAGVGGVQEMPEIGILHLAFGNVGALQAARTRPPPD